MTNERIVNIPKRMNTPRCIVELFFAIAQAFSIKSLSLSVRNGGLSLIRISAMGKGEYGPALRDVMSRLLDGERRADYGGARSWEEALIYLCGCSEWRFSCYDERDGLWHEASNIQGQREEACYAGEPGYELTVINAFSSVPEIYRNLERDYIQTMNIVHEARRFCLENPQIALRLENNGRPFFRTPGDGSMDGCLTHLFSRMITAQLQRLEEAFAGGVAHAYFMTAAASSVERDLAVVRLNGRAVREEWVLCELQKRYQNDFSACHFVFVLDVESPSLRELPSDLFLAFVGALPIQKIPVQRREKEEREEREPYVNLPAFLSPGHMEQAVLPDVRGKLEVEKVFGRFFLIRQEQWLYLFDYMEVLTRFRMTEIQQEYQGGKILTTACHLEIAEKPGERRVDAAFKERCRALGFTLEEDGEGRKIVRSYPYYLKAGMVPAIAENLLSCMGTAHAEPSREELLYLIAYSIVSAENSNRSTAASENVVMLMEMAHRMLQTGFLPRESVPIYRIGCNAYDRRDREK